VREALGNVVIEAKLAGCCSIVFPSGGLCELIEEGVDGIVCRDVSAEALAEALRPYLSNPELARQHGQAARASLARLGIANFAQRWLQIYETIPRRQERPSSHAANESPARE
jgi:glycosyltransferase involved in cell wall biosynthesis